MTGLQDPNQVHYYFYETQDINGYIYLVTNYKQETTISQSYGAIHVIPPQENIDKIRPIMDKIEKTVGESCNITDFNLLMKESCSEVKCEQKNL